MNSVPTSGASASARTKLPMPARTTIARGVMVAKRQRRGSAAIAPSGVVERPAERGQRRHEHAVAARREDPADQPLVDAVQEVEQPVGAAHQLPEHRHLQQAVTRRIAPDARQHRVEREAHEERHQDRHRDRHAEREEELADDALHERDRNEHGADREGRRHHRQADLVGGHLRRLAMAAPEVDVADDVFAHDDRVVDQAGRCTATAPSSS